MDRSLSHEFLAVMNNFRKLKSMNYPTSKIRMGECIMLGAIHGCMKENIENHIEDPGVRVGNLSELIQSTKPATSKMLKAIEEKGYVERVTDIQDRRVIYVRLTDTGKTIIEDTLKRMDDFTDRTIQRMGEKDASDLIHLLKKLQDAISYELIEENSKSE